MQDDLIERPLFANPITGMTQAQGMLEGLPFKFERMSVSITFVGQNDLLRFMQIPKQYFDAVKKRDPREGANWTETLLFKSSVQVYEQLKAETMKPTAPRKMWNSCEMRILEISGKEGWRTTRRLVVTSSAAESQPWCIDFFLPLSGVRIQLDLPTSQVLMKWSDVNHEKPGLTDGSYNKVYTYVYDHNNPNIALSLQFRHAKDAAGFSDTILTLSTPPIYVTPSSEPSPRYVYDVADTEPDPKEYKALLSHHIRNSWTFSELVYMYSNTDYQYDSSTHRLKLPSVYRTHYISTHVDRLYKPEKPPTFSYCERRSSSITTEFSTEEAAMGFLSALTKQHALVFSRRANWLTTKPSPRFGSAKSNKGSCEIQLWRSSSGQTTKLVSRWDDHVEDKWISLTVPRGAAQFGHPRDSNRAVLPKCDYNRGRQIAMAGLTATNPKVSSEWRKQGPVTIAFETVKDREAFLEAMDGEGGLNGRRRGLGIPGAAGQHPMDVLLNL